MDETYLEGNQLLSDNQSSYRSKCSIELATAHFVDSVRKSSESGVFSELSTWIDLSKAIDTLNHGRLLEKMKSYRVT